MYASPENTIYKLEIELWEDTVALVIFTKRFIIKIFKCITI